MSDEFTFLSLARSGSAMCRAGLAACRTLRFLKPYDIDNNHLFSSSCDFGGTMPILLLQLPPEIIVEILCHLDLPDIISCILTHSSLYAFTREFQILQYHIAMQAAAVTDNPDCQLSISDRLALLKRREDGWAQLQVHFRKKIPLNHNPSGIYDMTGGIYLLGDQNRRTLHYCVLPSSLSESTTWSRINLDCDLIDAGLAIYEHDLIAIITTYVLKYKLEKY